MVSILCLSSLNLFAKEHKDKNWDKMTFEQQKEMKLKWLDQKAAWIESSRSCINEAKDKAALKNCKDEMRAEKKSMKEEWNKTKKQAQEETKKD
jgi:hypothetical protein